MLAWLPLLGPIIQGILSTGSTIYSKFKDTQLGMRTAEVDEAKVSAQIIATTNDDICLRIIRDAICVPVAVWTMLIGWDNLVAENSWHEYMWHVASYPDSVKYIPYAVLVFLLGNIGMNMANHK